MAPPHGELQNPKIRLYPKDFDQHGITTGCPKCNYFLEYGKWKRSHGIQHLLYSVRCRERMITEMAKSLKGQRRIAAASYRGRGGLAVSHEGIEDVGGDLSPSGHRRGL